jgi:hypothetical protein
VMKAVVMAPFRVRGIAARVRRRIGRRRHHADSQKHCRGGCSEGGTFHGDGLLSIR